MKISDVGEKIRKYLQKLRALPENKKKIILWAVVVILGLPMGFFWVKNAIYNFSRIGEAVKSIEIPKVDTSDAPTIPDLDLLDTATSAPASVPTNK